MSPAPKKPTPEEAEKAEAKADEQFIAEEDAKVEEADAREEAKAQAAAEAEAEAPAEAAEAAEDAPAEKPKSSRRRRGAAKQADPEPAPAPRRERASGPGVTVKAQAKYVRTSARKARLVCDHIRGKDVEEARAILAFTPRGAAEAWSKLLESAVANAEHNHELVGDELRIASVHADEGPTLKRFRPRAMGRATRIRKRTSHLTITLTPKDQV